MENFTKRYEHSTSQPGIKLGSGLILINLLSVVLITVYLFTPTSVIRPILAVPFLMVFPGYALLVAVFPVKDQISGMERFVFSFILSLALAILTGLALNYTPWEIKVEPVLYSLSALIFFISAIAWVRLKSIQKSQRFGINLDLSWLKGSKSLTNNFITFILVISILFALSYMIYASTESRVTETYSEFYILGQDGGTDEYPQLLTLGDEGRVNIGIGNHEGRDVTYSIVINSNGESSNAVEQLLLSNGQEWEGQLNFLASTPGENMKVEFLLYREGDESPYRKLHLMIDVTS